MSANDAWALVGVLFVAGTGVLGGFLWGHSSGYKQAFSEARRIAPLLPDTYTLEEIRKAWAQARRSTKKHDTDCDIADLVGALERPEE